MLATEPVISDERVWTLIILLIQVFVVPLQAWMLKQIVDLRINEASNRVQLERLAADAESEKRTRAEANKIINLKLDELTERKQIT